MIDETSLNEAIITWTGHGRSPSPTRDVNSLVEAYGEERARELFPIIKRLEDEFYASDARHSARTLQETGDLAAARFRELHPELWEEAVQALAWCYTFDHK